MIRTPVCDLLDIKHSIALGERLHALANEPKRFVRFEHGDHRDPDRYGALAVVREFIAGTVLESFSKGSPIQ